MIARIALLAGCLAAAAPAIGAEAAAVSPAVAPVAALNSGLAALEKNAAKPFQARYDIMAPVVDKSFDLPQVLKTIIGLKYDAIPAPQKQTLFTVFRQYTVCNYVANFNSDSGDEFRILPDTRAAGADQVVETEIVPKSGDHVRIDYVMRQTGGAWRAIDVLEDGTISQAAVQRSDFRALLAGGNADALIASLQTKVKALSGGAIKS